MSDVRGILLNDARQALLIEVSGAAGRNDLQEAFATWLVPEAAVGLGIDGAVTVAVNASGAERRSNHIAVLGLAAQVRSLTDTERRALLSGLDWMVNREPVVGGTPMGFCMDGVALAAFVLGAKATGDDSLWAKTCEWVGRCRNATAGGHGLEPWQEWFISRVAEHTGLTWARKADECSDAAEVRVALRSKGIGASDLPSVVEADECELLGVIHRQSTSCLGIPRAAIRLAALDWTRRERPILDLRAVNTSAIADLLRRVPAGLKKWTWEEKPRTKGSALERRWHIENEYHVQNALWLLLAPLLPDLIDEDATPKVGPVQPRADIGVPSLRLVVEAKFMRAGDPPKKMVEQVAEDASLYLVAGSRYDQMIPFIWDDSRRTEHHQEMIQGLRQIAGVIDAVIVPRPGRMLSSEDVEGSARSDCV